VEAFSNIGKTMTTTNDSQSKFRGLVFAENGNRNEGSHVVDVAQSDIAVWHETLENFAK